MTRIYPVPVAPAAMMLGTSPTHRQAMANATAQPSTASTTPLSTASTAVASTTTVKASDITFGTSFYELAFGPARFSTHMGHSPMRSIPRSTDDRPCPIIRSDIGKDVRERVAALEQQYPDFVRLIKEPRGYRDLYEYFDGYDLYVEGVLFCWHVIATIGNKNALLNKLADHEIDEYAKQWVMFHEDRVIYFSDIRDLTELFNVDELDGLNDLLPGQLQALKAKLLIYREKLLRDYRKKEAGPTMRPTKLYPVLEGGRSPAVSEIQPHDPQSVGGGRFLPPVPLLPVSHMNNYGRFQTQPRPAGNWQNRPRGVSDAARLRGPRYPNLARRTLSSKGSPLRDNEPVYVYNSGSERPPQLTTSSGTLSRVSGDVRVSGLEGTETPAAPQMSEPEIVYPFEREGFNGALTFHYAPKSIDDNNDHTVYVAPVAREMYANHELQRMMSECGEVENVHYPFAEGNHGPAFVKFINAESIELAIQKFDQFQLPTTGVILSVSYPRPRLRSSSNATQKTSFRTPRDFQEFNPNGPRRQTLRQRTYSGSNNGPNYSVSKSSTMGETSILMGIQSQASEMVQHQAAMDRLPSRSNLPLEPMDRLPLGSIENQPLLPTKPQIKSNIQGSSKKENSPMKLAPFHTPTKESEQKPARGVKSKKSRGNKQNTSTRPTPASTPVRSMSMAQLSDMIENPPPQMALLQELKQLQEEAQTAQSAQSTQVPLSLDTSSGPPQKRPKKKKNKTSAAKSLSTSPSFVTDTSEPLQSPTEAGATDSFTSKSSPTEVGTTDSFTSQSANTSHTNLSSRKQSLASGNSDTSLTLEMSMPATADGPETKQRAAGGKGRKPGNQNHSKKESNPKSPTESKEISEPSQQNKGTQQPQPKKDTHENIQAKQVEKEKDAKKELKDQQKEAKKENTPKNRSKDAEQPKNKKDNNVQNHAKAEQQAQPKKDAQERPDTKENEPPKTSKKEDTGSQRKTDAKSAGTKKFGDTGPASQNFPVKVAQSPPKQVLADPTEWPALNPSASPQSAIADGKRPPPLSAPALRLPVHSKPIVPAVPAMPRKPRPQPIDLPDLDPPAIPEPDLDYPPFVEEFDYPWEDMADLPPPGPLGGPDWPFVKSFRESID